MASTDSKINERMSNKYSKSASKANGTGKKTTTAQNAEQAQTLIGEQVGKAKTALKNQIKQEIVGGAIKEAFAELAAGDFGDIACQYLEVISDFTESLETSTLAIEAYENQSNFLLNPSEQRSESELKEVVLLGN